MSRIRWYLKSKHYINDKWIISWAIFYIDYKTINHFMMTSVILYKAEIDCQYVLINVWMMDCGKGNSKMNANIISPMCSYPLIMLCIGLMTKKTCIVWFTTYTCSPNEGHVGLHLCFLLFMVVTENIIRWLKLTFIFNKYTANFPYLFFHISPDKYYIFYCIICFIFRQMSNKNFG